MFRRFFDNLFCTVKFFHRWSVWDDVTENVATAEELADEIVTCERVCQLCGRRDYMKIQAQAGIW